MNVDEKKQERSKAKMAVTVASRRLIGAYNRDSDFDIVKNLMLELEKVFDDFCTINEEYELIVSNADYAEHRIVNGEDIKTYRENVKLCYQEASNTFSEAKNKSKQVSLQQRASHIISSIKSDICKIRELTILVDNSLDSDNVNLDSLQLDKNDLQSTLDKLCESMGKLYCVEGHNQIPSIQDEVDDIVGVVYNRIRKINLILHTSAKAVNTKRFGMDVTIGDELLPTDQPNVSTLVGGTSPVVSNASVILDNTSQASNQPVNITTSTLSAVNYSTDNTAPTQTSMSTSSPVAVNTTVTQANTATNGSELSPQIMTTPLNITAQTFFPASTSQPASATDNNIFMVGPTSPLNNAQSTIHLPVYTTSVAPVVHYPSQSATVSNPSVPSSSSNLAPQSVYTVAPVQQTVTLPPMRSLNQESTIRLKRMSLPTFSGQRKDWPEFKAVWKSMAESSNYNKTALAHELKNSVRGVAKHRVKSVYVTKPEAYDIMWEKLENYYEDTTASVQAALKDLHKLKSVKEEDYKGLVELVDEVESAYNQLKEVNHLNTLTMRDVDAISELLPVHLKVDWRRKYQHLTPLDKLQPFAPFMKFLEQERSVVARLAENQHTKRSNEVNKGFNRSYHTERSMRFGKKYYKCAFPTHRKETVNHTTEECNEFKKLPISGKDGRYELLKQVNACFKCFGNHRKQECQNKIPCSSCGSDQHHSLLCIPLKDPKVVSDKELASHATRSDSLALYPIHQASVSDSNKKLSIFCDGGSNATYITHRAADRIKAKRIRKLSLDVTTMGNVEKTYKTCQYEFTVNTGSGKKVSITAYGMDRITGTVSKLDPKVLAQLFPDYDPETLQRKSSHVDVLLGCDYFGLHPKREEARCGDNLSIMSGDLGICLQGAHPDLMEETKYDANLAKEIHNVNTTVETCFTRLNSHSEFFPSLHQQSKTIDVIENKPCSANFSSTPGNRKEESQIENFIQGEELGTEITPRCGGCRCSKCPSVGHTYSFKEEQELKMIHENLEYDEDNQRWLTSYPWLKDPLTLPDNYQTAYATLQRTEQTLKKDQKWADTYKDQINDMIEREVARKLSSEEVKEWSGPVFYISHLAVVNPRSQSTPVRIVFNSSQTHQGVSLNACLAKGPDSYMNNLVGILLRWREERVALIGDIRKMFNSVHLKILEQHCHRFLWRGLRQDQPPDIYVIQRVNMGDTPAPAISTEAVYKTADRFEEDSTEAANLLKRSSYVDDLIDSRPSKPEALKISKEADDMLEKGGFSVKCWQFSGESRPRVKKELLEAEIPEENSEESEKSISLLKGTQDSLRVLGLGWDPINDTIIFEVTLNFTRKKRGVRIGPNLVEADLPDALPSVLTRRIVLEQVMKIYDPLGLISPFTLLAKIYLRETWTLKLTWDDPLPADLCNKWCNYFTALFKLQRLRLERCLRPTNSVGLPWLIILSDGSDLAYGFAAYIRWQLADGTFWCRLIMAKCRIAPIKKLSTPQLELNAAVLSKRGRKVLEKEMRFDFERVLQIVDSETVLSMIMKTSTRFKVYEGVRIGEIQAATDGDVTCWAWMSGQHNTADWLTRGRTPEELNNDSHWWNGPPILYRPIEEWGLKFKPKKEVSLLGEKKVHTTATATAEPSLIDYERFSDIRKVIWVVARLLSVAKKRSFRGGRTTSISVQFLREAESFIVRDVQKSMKSELLKSDHKGRRGGRYASLNPIQSEDGSWVVGQRLSQHNPMTLDSSLQKLLPSRHHITRLLMKRAHLAGHRGRDATLARFRQYYWVVQGSKLAQSVKSRCQMCKLREAKLQEQQMAPLPVTRLKPSPAFNYVMVDLFGPYPVRGEVQKRTSGKAYGVIFTDLVMRATHIEAVFGYDTESFLMAFSRFVSVRGWPEVIYSDPGSQLVGAEKELREAWKKIDHGILHKNDAENGTTWIFGPADSPWYQGAVESLVKSVKRAIHFAVNNQRLSVQEFLTVCSESSNLLNERPIGTIPGADSELNILTPNSLLLGRATAKNPGEWQPNCHNPRKRYHVVQTVVDEFWKKWTELYAPALVLRRKWNTANRNLCPGDVVIIADKNTMRGEYRLGMVKEVFPSKDNKVRRVAVMYKRFRVGEKVQEYKGHQEAVVVFRSTQRLALLVPVD